MCQHVAQSWVYDQGLGMCRDIDVLVRRKPVFIGSACIPQRRSNISGKERRRMSPRNPELASALSRSAG